MDEELTSYGYKHGDENREHFLAHFGEVIPWKEILYKTVLFNDGVLVINHQSVVKDRKREIVTHHVVKLTAKRLEKQNVTLSFPSKFDWIAGEYSLIANAEELVVYSHRKRNVLKNNSLLWLLLLGCYSPQSPFSLLKAHAKTIVWMIHETVTSWIRQTTKLNTSNAMKQLESSYIQFPSPTGINIKMLPFIIKSEDSIPAYLEPYKECLMQYFPFEEDQAGQIAYLTIEERDEDDTHSAPVKESGMNERCGGGEIVEKLDGKKKWVQVRKDGIYIVSKYDDLALCDVVVDYRTSPHNLDCYKHSFHPVACKHVRGRNVFWLTDETPYMFLPSKKRQYIKVVCGDDVEWKEGWTKNDLMIMVDVESDKPKKKKSTFFLKRHQSHH